MPTTISATSRRFRGACEWADEVVDHRDVGGDGDDLPAVPEWLPTPGCSSANPLWDAGQIDFEAPDTSHLPSGGPGGMLSVSAHVLGGARTTGYVATVMTFPDGYRLGSLWPTTGRTTIETWRGWMNGPDGMGHAFTRSAAAWSVAQRAWAARRWYDFVAAAPDGASLMGALEWETGQRAVTSGMLGEQGARLAQMDPSQMTALQQAGFWLPDAKQTNWLGDGGTPFATALADAPSASTAASRLYDMYVSGWTVEAFRNWWPVQPVDSTDRLRAFLTATGEWDTTITEACALMQAKADRRTSAVTDDDVRTGEIASLCLRLGLTPFHVGVMVGEGSFNVEALRTMVALRTPAATNA